MTTQTPTLKECNKALQSKDYLKALKSYYLYAKNNPKRAFIARQNILLITKLLQQKRERNNVEKILNFQKPEWLEEYYFNKIKESGLFDLFWYINNYGLKHEIYKNPLDHYLQNCTSTKLNPSEKFNTDYYLTANPDVKEAGVHPFIHYITQGVNENRPCTPPPPRKYDSKYEVMPVEYIPRSTDHIQESSITTQVIAFYLPQFHAIKENNQWWGKGFTEWSNVKPAQPLFKGHYQPHVPDSHIGYYNLLEKNIFKKQIDLAKQYGITGFCFYIYWFTGHKLLERPVELYLNSEELDHPFCVCWANENWSRRWDGLDNELLIEQKYSAEDDVNFIKDTSKYFHDKRYIRIDNKPILLIYRPSLFPNIKHTVSRWRNWCRENGVGEIFLVYPQSFESAPPENYGFDAAVEFPPNNSNPPDITNTLQSIEKGSHPKIYDWRVFLDRSDSYPTPAYKLYRAVTPSWDNTARKKGNSTIFYNSCPKLFEKWMINAIKDTILRFEKKNDRMIFVNAWNEWAEGAHLEPDLRYGYAWLQAIKDAHEKISQQKRKILIVGHDAHPHGAQLLCLNICKHLQKMNFDVHLILLNDGKLLGDFQKTCTTHLIKNESEDTIIRRLYDLQKAGITNAISNTTVSGSILPLLKRIGFNVISLIHEMPQVLKSYGLRTQAENIRKHADNIVFPSEIVKDGFEDFIGSKLNNAVIRPQGMYMPIPVNPKKTKAEIKLKLKSKLNIPESSKIILSAGYADERKGFDIFVKSAYDVIKNNENIYFIWIGHHDKIFVEKSLKEIPSEIKQKIILPGIIKDPTDFFMAADLYILTSREDPFPSVVMESLACLTPVICFKETGGATNLIEKTGGITLSKIDNASLSLAITELINDTPRANLIGEKGRLLIETQFQFRKYLFDLTDLLGFNLKRISAIVPNYNYEKYIERRLESIEKQTYPIYEIIVLDDKSTDGSITRIETHLASSFIPFKTIFNTINSGSVFKQWALGIEHSEGDYIWIAEADDLASPYFAERVLPSEDENITISFCQSSQIDESNRDLAKDYLYYTKSIGDYWEHDYIIDGVEEIKRALYIKNTIPNVSATILPKKHLKPILHSIFQDLVTFRVAGDWFLYIALAIHGKVKYVKDSLNVHRRHSNSVTHTTTHDSEVKRIHETIRKKIDIPESSRKLAKEFLNSFNETRIKNDNTQ